MPSNEKTLKYFFQKLYNNGNLTNLIISSKRIKELDELYKNNFNKYSIFDDFEHDYPEYFADYKKSKSAYQEIKKQFNSNSGLQPCILTECFVAQTIANHLNLCEYIDLDSDDSVPVQLMGAIYAAQGYSDGSKFRYCYYNNHFDALVFQCGASGTVDIVFTKFNFSIRIEVKEQTAKLEECDIIGLYGEDGKLLISEKFKSERSKYIPYVNIFNEITNVFEMEGHNFNFNQYLSNDSAKSIIADVLDMKVVDVFILVIDNKIVPVIPNYLLDFVTFEGSEIRTAGRNAGKVYTPGFVNNKIEELGGHIIDDIVYLPYNQSLRVKGRNLDYFTRYSIGSLLFVKLENTKIVDNKIVFKLSDIWQKKPSISIHLNSKINYDSLHIQLQYVSNL